MPKLLFKVYKYHTLGYQTRQAYLERIAKLASIQARKPFTKSAKANKDLQAKAKRLMREMQVFWKKNEKEERDVRKREQKEAMDRLKIEEEKREAARQARKLEFLISQTELYSHFVGSKLKSMPFLLKICLDDFNTKTSQPLKSKVIARLCQHRLVHNFRMVIQPLYQKSILMMVCYRLFDHLERFTEAGIRGSN